MADHYETLGVPRDATPDQIRQAGRRAASAAHPDRAGGSHERMTAVNVAIEVLSDPERRARYDETGSDAAASSTEDVVRAGLAQAFSQALDSCDEYTNLIDAVRSALKARRANLPMVEAKRDQVRLRQRREKLKGPEPNLLHGLIDQRLAAIDEKLAQMDEAARLIDAMLVALDGYSDEPRERPAQAMGSMRSIDDDWFRQMKGMTGFR